MKEGLDDLEPLGYSLFLRVGCGLFHLRAQYPGDLLEVDPAEHLADGLCAHANGEAVKAPLLHGLLILFLVNDLAFLEVGLLGVEDDVVLVIQDPFQLLERHVHHGAYPGGKAAEEPDVRHRGCELYVSEPFAPYIRGYYLDAALLADDPAVLHPLVLAAVAFEVLYRAEYLGAEKTVPLGLECPVVYGFRLLHLAVGPLPDPLGRSDRYPYGVKIHRSFMFLKKCYKAFQRATSFLSRFMRPVSGPSIRPCYSFSSSISSISSPRLWSSFIRTLNDSGSVGSRV